MTIGEGARGVLAPSLLDLQQVDTRRFRSVQNQDNGLHAIFGGQALAQALAAAQRTAPAWPAHTGTGYFLRGGAVAEPVDYEVEIVRDGRRYASRRVVASQMGKAIFDFLCSFHHHEPGPSHQIDDPEEAPDPEGLPGISDFIRANASRLSQRSAEIAEQFPIDLRVIDGEGVRLGMPGAPKRSYWLRLPSAKPLDDPRDHQALLAYLSDYWFPSAAGAPHQSPERVLKATSLNHTIWFHAPVRVDDWLLWRTDSPCTGEGRGLARALIYDRAGKLVASAAQELSMRWGEL